MNCPHCKTEVDEHPANLCLNQWVAVEVMDGRLENYSAMIAAAWEVVEKMAVGFSVAVSWPYMGIYWACYLGDKNGHVASTVGDETSWSVTAPLAICRAALKAVGEERQNAIAQDDRDRT